VLTRAARNSMARGRNGADLAHLAYLGVPELYALAANGLVAMLDPEKQLFCYRLNRTPRGLVREGLSHRYTIMSLLGLHRLEARGQRSLPVDTRSIFDALLVDLAWVSNIGDLGLLVWLCAATRPELLEEVYSTLDVKGALARFRGAQNGVTMELAWFLSGLAHAALAGKHELPDLPALSAKTLSLLTANQGKHGTFGHLAKSGSILGVLRGHVGSFADQVYPIYALAKFSEAFQNRTALESAQGCAEAICRAQGPLGQWWWHYDALTGKVLQRYPVYSVHQHGMAPMALLALSAVSGSDFSQWLYKGLAWIDGNNELDRDLRDPSSNLVWRSVYRGSPAKAHVKEFVEFLRDIPSPVPAGDLKIKFECRPYELGWLLYAFAGRDRD
jgi:hypothetical protein